MTGNPPSGGDTHPLWYSLAMDDLLPQGTVLNRDSLIAFMAETKSELRHFTEAVNKLARTVEEAVLRFETEMGEMADSLGGLRELRNGHGDLGRRISDVEKKAGDLEVRVTRNEVSTNTVSTTVKVWISALTLGASIIGGLIGHFLPK